LAYFAGARVLAYFAGARVLAYFTGARVLAYFTGARVLAYFSGARVLAYFAGARVLAYFAGDGVCSTPAALINYCRTSAKKPESIDEVNTRIDTAQAYHKHSTKCSCEVLKSKTKIEFPL
jgi:hypothetical protein